MVVAQALHEIPRDKFHVIEFRKIKNMRFGEYRRGNIQLMADFREIIEKMRIGQFFGIFIYDLLFYSAARHQFRPNPHILSPTFLYRLPCIIHVFREKVNRFKKVFRNFGIFPPTKE